MANISSTNPLKKLIVKVLKEKSKGTKVTNVKESKGIFSGDCWKFKGPEWQHLGSFECTAKEIGL